MMRGKRIRRVFRRREDAPQHVLLHCRWCGHEERNWLRPSQALACPRCHLYENRIRWLKRKGG